MSPQNDLEYLINHTHSSEIMSTIGGNASLFIKEAAVRWYMMLDVRGSSSFEHSMRKRLELKEVSIEPSPDDPKKMSSKLVCDLEVTPDLCNEEGVLSHGSMTCLMDEGSAISLVLMRLMEDENHVIGVTQTFNFFFHHPAPPPNSKIRIISRSVSTDEDVGCCQSEIWDVENHRLIVSGTQLQMKPSVLEPGSIYSRQSKL